MQLLCLSLVLMRCQPLRRALAEVKKNHKIKRLFFLVLGSSFTPECRCQSVGLTNGSRGIANAWRLWCKIEVQRWLKRDCQRLAIFV
ncbi:hypothetical protein DD770_12705 [Vibrio anguillarum]|nr:hypothetical protein DD770_12705 [Vibrio anguillarum]